MKALNTKFILITLGLATFGIGHLIRTDDPEYGQPVGTPVTEERVEAAFQADMEIVIKDCHNLYDDFEELPETRKTCYS